MKKFLVLLVSVLCLSSCSGFNRTTDGSLTTTTEFGMHIKLVDIEFNGEKHEYVYFHQYDGRSLSHWEGCKYCKERNK